MHDDPPVAELREIAASTDPSAPVPATVRSTPRGRLGPADLLAGLSVPLSAGLMQSATAGLVLVDDGSAYPLPGLVGHPLLAGTSPVVDVARRMLAAGQAYRTFLWPADDGPGYTGHARITVLAAQDVPRFVLGTLLVTPEADCRGLTPRELGVLGLVVEGHSNQQIARRLGLSPSTVATHLEHILHKLEVPTRTLAAVRAEREGCHVPPSPGLAAGQ